MLESIRVIGNEKLANKKLIRLNTNLLYRQHKYNLLREESEGWAKMIVLLWAGAATSSQYRLGSMELKAHSEQISRNMKSLIGYFNLDPNQVLALLLNIFIFTVEKSCHFWITILLSSSWRPRQNHRKIMNQRDKSIDGMRKNQGEDTGTNGNIIAQVLGYRISQLEDATETSLDERIFSVTALLIKHGLITLDDIWDHMSPTDEQCLLQWRDYQIQVKNASKNTTSEKFSALAVNADILFSFLGTFS